MVIRVKIRGIYSTALTKLFLDAGYAIVDPTPEIQERFDLPSGGGSPQILIQNRLDHQGVEILGEADQISRVVRLFQEILFDAILLEFTTPAEVEEVVGREGEDLARARMEFPGIAKGMLDRIRSAVIPTLDLHHRLRIIDAQALKRAEKQLLGHPERKEGLEKEMFQKMVLEPLRQGELIRLEHIKVSAKGVRPREGVRVELKDDPEGWRLVMKRTFQQGRYDGLHLPIEPGDYSLTEVLEGAFFLRHAYYSRDGKLKGEYYNINTAVEFYPAGARYVDLEIDVIRRPGEKPFVEDREKLALLGKKRWIGAEL
ncbi:MAG: DUF402 domain-containing protein, partial [Deltaproteobacteria bacterium]|nr:DUF402 domain-containing protein [Deltaproteobacteria bacterium]